MNYCTAADMITRFGEQELIALTDHNNGGVLDVPVLEQAMSDAGAEIDGYLSQYTLPLAIVPAVLVRGSCDIARYYLYDDAVTDLVKERYQAVIKYLTLVARGTVSLGVDQAGQVPVLNNSAVMHSDGRVFARADKGFI